MIGPSNRLTLDGPIITPVPWWVCGEGRAHVFEGLRVMGLAFVPWVQGWKRLEILTDLSRSRLEKLARYEGLPLLWGPLNEPRIHPLSFWKWMNNFPSHRTARARRFDEVFKPDDRWVAEAVAWSITNNVAQVAGCPVEALWISTWRSIAHYAGFRSPTTGAKLHDRFGMPCWLIAGRVRSIPSVIDLFFETWGEIKKEHRKNVYFKNQNSYRG